MELVEYWKIKYTDKDSDDIILEKTRKHMLKSDEAKISKDIRNFLKKLSSGSKKIDYSFPVWEGMLKIEHDETLIRFAVELLPCMWN